MSVRERIELGLLALGLILIAAGALQARYRYVGGRHRGRRFYWVTSAIGTCFFAVGVGKIWPNGILVALFFAAIVAGSAYLSTPYLKIGARIYALSRADREPDPPDEEMEKK
ncbi:MAG: hypothetical protein WBZ37_18880 [Mycobacterium sp.]